MKFVLDSSALLSGKDFRGELYTTPEALKEVKKIGMTPQLEALFSVRVSITSPSRESINAVKEEAKKTGDVKRLSPTDVGILALAKELSAVVLTDDYSIQNLAKELGLEYRGVAISEIKEKIYWEYRCRGCGKFWEEWYNFCPICGSKLKTSRKR